MTIINKKKQKGWLKVNNCYLAEIPLMMDKIQILHSRLKLNKEI